MIDFMWIGFDHGFDWFEYKTGQGSDFLSHLIIGPLMFRWIS